MSHNFDISLVDTDSITVSKPDGSPFSEEEIVRLTAELNNQGHKHINWEFEFYIPRVVVLKSKNYILHDPKNKNVKKQLTIKGSALKASNKEFYLKDLIKGIINILLDTTISRGVMELQVVELYNKIALECIDVKDMSRFSFKKTFTKAVQEGQGTAELKARLALKHVDGVQQGDKFRMFYLSNSNLCLEKNFSGDYCKKTLLKKLFATVKIFHNILPTELFINYSLQTNYYPFIGEEKPKKAKKAAT